jgi:flagellar motor switch protein FliG
MSGTETSEPALTGADRAAIVLQELGEDLAAQVMRQMDEGSIARISAAMTRLPKTPREAREAVMTAFASDLGLGGHSSDGYAYISKVLISALGESQAREIIERLTRNERTSRIHMQINADPRTLAAQMGNERPQTLALLLAHVPHDTGASMLSYLPEALAIEALYRFTTLDVVLPGAVNELREMLGELVENSASEGRRLTNLGGAKQAADILNHLQSGLSERVMEAIEARDHDTAELIRENLFTFVDLSGLSDRALQILLREVPSDKLAPALRMVDESVRARFYQNMSARMVEVLKEELESGPPMRRADALASQGAVVEVALRLAAEGRITINSSEEMV